MAMIGIKMYCEDCDKWHTIKATSCKEIPDNCPKCGSNNTWFGEVIRDGKPEKKIIPGDRRSGNCFTAGW